MNDTDNYVQILTDSLTMKRAVLEKVISLNNAQRELLAADEFDGEAFRESVRKKGELIDEINRLDYGFENLFERVKEVLDKDKASYTNQINALKSLIRDVTDLSVKVQAEEARNKTLVEKRMSGLRREVANAKTHVSRTNTYYQTMNKIDYSPQFMDTKQ